MWHSSESPGETHSFFMIMNLDLILGPRDGRPLESTILPHGRVELIVPLHQNFNAILFETPHILHRKEVNN